VNARPLTIDASVFVRAAIPHEAGFEESADFLRSLGAAQRLVILPTLVKPEVAGALSRGLGDPEAVKVVLNELDQLADALFVPLDRSLAREAAEIARSAGLRGADAVYAATARRFDAVLVTLDRQQLERLPPDFSVCSPSEALKT